MADYTTVTLTADVKDELSADMQDGETWNEYLRRLQSETRTHETPESHESFSADQLDQIRSIVEEAVRETDHAHPDNNQSSGADIDYDHVREIVRDEVRRALEEIVR